MHFHVDVEDDAFIHGSEVTVELKIFIIDEDSSIVNAIFRFFLS